MGASQKHIKYEGYVVLVALNEPKPKVAVLETISYASIGSSSRYYSFSSSKYYSIVFTAKRFAHTENHERNVTPVLVLDGQLFVRKENDWEKIV